LITSNQFSVKFINSRNDFGIVIEIPNISQIGLRKSRRGTSDDIISKRDKSGFTIFSANFNKIVEAGIIIKSFFFILPSNEKKLPNENLVPRPQLNAEIAYNPMKSNLTKFITSVVPPRSVNPNNSKLIHKLEWFTDCSYEGMQVEFSKDKINWIEVFIPTLVSFNIGEY